MLSATGCGDGCVAAIPRQQTGVPPNLLRGQIERMPLVQFLWWWSVQPHWVPAVMAGAPSGGCGRVRAGGFSPTGFRRSSRAVLPVPGGGRPVPAGGGRGGGSAPLRASGHGGCSFLGVYAGAGGWVQPHWVPAVVMGSSFLTRYAGMAARGPRTLTHGDGEVHNTHYGLTSGTPGAGGRPSGRGPEPGVGW
jgi:hypothetical protein